MTIIDTTHQSLSVLSSSSTIPSSMSSSTATYDFSSSNLISQNTTTTSSSSSTSSTSNTLDTSSLSSYQNRNQNALQRRAQQLRRWREIEEIEKQNSENNDNLKQKSPTKVCFSPTTLFLSACVQRDIDECERLLRNKELRDAGGVNVTNCDGLTALHHACIDDNEQMVRWLLSKSANINCKDNEGWTPLHASANCDNQNIVKILIANPSCDLFALNCDNELACDVCETKECEDLIRAQMKKSLTYDLKARKSVSLATNRPIRVGIGRNNDNHHANDDDEDENEEIYKNLRQQELKAIDRDIDAWIDSKKNNPSSFDIREELERTRDPLSGATILHVCAAKGYQNSLEKFLQTFSSSLDLDSFRDCDGYTALHAAAFWRQPETFEILLKFGANPDLMTEKTTDNIMSSSVLELCKNDPKFVELIEVNKEKEKIAKESETQRKIFAKRQREQRRSTQGVKREDLEQALKMMEMARNASSLTASLDTSSDIKRQVDDSVDNDDKIMADDSHEENVENYNHSNNDDNDNNSCSTTAVVSLSSLRRSSNTTEDGDNDDSSEPTSSLTIKLPSRPMMKPLVKTDSGQLVNGEIVEANLVTTCTPKSPITPPPTTTTSSSSSTTSGTETPPITMKIQMSTPAEFAKRRRIKRRSTGIEDDSGHALSPDILADAIANPLTTSSINNNNSNSNNTNDTSGKVDAAFEITLSTPTNPATRSSRIITRPAVSNASSLSSLNSTRSRDQSSLADDIATATTTPTSNISAASSINSLSSYDSNNNTNTNNNNNNNLSSSSSYANENNNNDNNVYNSYSRSNLNNANNDQSMTNSTSDSTKDLKDISNLISSDEIDYKKLCKQLLRENETLRKRLKEIEEMDKKREQEFNREKRSLQRNISELEEELKIINDIKADNMRLKDENAALIRVISKLSKN